MITIVSNGNQILYSGYGDYSVQKIDVSHELEGFDPDKFIKEVRTKQIVQKIKNKQRYEKLKKNLISRGYIVDDSDFNPEEALVYNYGGDPGSVLTISKGDISIDLWANGNQHYMVFDDEWFFLCLWEQMILQAMPRDRFQYIKNGFYYFIKLKMEGSAELGGLDHKKVFDLLLLTDKEKELIQTILTQNICIKEYINQGVCDSQLPISWFAGFYETKDSNWIEIFLDYKGEQLNVGDVADEENFLDVLEYIDDLYNEAVELSAI